MPLPDANKKSPRVYTNLQNLDLDNVSFANVQSTGNPIAVEEMNEDEMRRLVLVNLARLVCAGEWNGLLTAGGGEQFAFQPIDASLLPATYSKFQPFDVYRQQSTTTASTSINDKATFYRFVAPKDGAIGDITVRTNATNTSKDDAKIGIYETSGGLPSGAGIGFIDIDVNGGADLYTSSSWSTTPTLTAGDTYWIGFCSAGAANPLLATATYTEYLSIGATHYPGTAYSSMHNNGGSDYDMPSTVDLADLILANAYTYPQWMFQYS